MRYTLLRYLPLAETAIRKYCMTVIQAKVPGEPSRKLIYETDTEIFVIISRTFEQEALPLLLPHLKKLTNTS